MSEEEQPSVAELADRASEYAHVDELSPNAYEDALHAVAELTPIFTHHRSCFVLGSYGTYEIRRLQLVKDRLNREPSTYAFLMIDMQGEWYNTIVKFRLLADYVTQIIGIAEHNESGFLVEQGMFIARSEYFVKTHGLKREYDEETLEREYNGKEPFSQFQMDIFSMLEREGRLSVWRTDEELVACAEELIE
jgi:hypothetical protein